MKVPPTKPQYLQGQNSINDLSQSHGDDQLLAEKLESLVIIFLS